MAGLAEYETWVRKAVYTRIQETTPAGWPTMRSTGEEFFESPSSRKPAATAKGRIRLRYVLDCFVYV